MNVTDETTAEYGVEINGRNEIYYFIHYFLFIILLSDWK